MTRLAFGAKWGRPGKPPWPVASVSACSLFPNNPASAARPIPVALRAKKCRRVNRSPVSSNGPIFIAPSLLRHRLIQIQDQARDAGVGSQFSRVQLLVLWRVAVIQKTFGGFPIAAVTVLKFFQRVEYDLGFGGPGRPRQHQ